MESSRNVFSFPMPFQAESKWVRKDRPATAKRTHIQFMYGLSSFVFDFWIDFCSRAENLKRTAAVLSVIQRLTSMVSAIRVATCWSIMFSVIITHLFNTVCVELTKSSKATNLTTFFSSVTQVHLFYSKIRLNSVILYCWEIRGNQISHWPCPKWCREPSQSSSETTLWQCNAAKTVRL